MLELEGVDDGWRRDEAKGRRGAHSQFLPKNVQKVCPFAYALIVRYITLILTCRLFPRVPYALLEVRQALLFHIITRVYPQWGLVCRVSFWPIIYLILSFLVPILLDFVLSCSHFL